MKQLLELKEIAEVIRGISFSSDQGLTDQASGTLPVIRAGNIGPELNLIDDLIFVPEKLFNLNQLIKKNDIIMCTSSGSTNIVGKCNIAKSDWNGSFGAFNIGIRTNHKICNPYYLYYFLCSGKFRQWCKQSSGANIKNIRKTELESFKIPLPPLEVQKKIAAVLEKADALRRKREEQIKRLDDLLQATFLDMFGDIFNNSKRLKKAEFGQFIKSIRYGTGSPPEFSQTGIPFIRATNVKERTIKYQGMAFISAEEARKIEKCKVSEGDLIIVRSGVNTGDCARIPRAFHQAYGGYDLIIEIDEPFSSFYNYFFSTQSARLVIDGLSRRAGQPHLNAEQVKAFPVLVPENSQMKKFVKILTDTEKIAESILSRQKTHNNLFNSLMQRAFKGELELK